jgi:peptidyl-prolyl cis-trans isomerase C
MSAPLPEITVNGVPLPPQALLQEAQNHPAADPSEALRSAARALVLRELLLQEARREGIEAEAERDAQGRLETDEDALIRGLLEERVETEPPDEESCRRYFEKNRARFRGADLFEARHILLPAAGDDVEARLAAETLARSLIAELERSPGDFAALAEAHSACPSRAQGGHLGQLTRGQTVPEFETFLCNLEEGQLCPVPVSTRYGIHVLRLERKRLGAELPFEAVRERVAAYLEAVLWNKAVARYLRQLAARSRVEGIDLEGLERS